MVQPENRIPDSEPHGLADFWTLILLAAAGVCVWLFFDSADMGDADMLGLGQQGMATTGFVICVLAFLFFGIRNKAYFGRWFTDKTRN